MADPHARTVLHVAPHADDESIGAPATLMALRDAGWRVLNLTCSLGPEQHKQRRRDEVSEACRRAGFELRIADVMRSVHAEELLTEAVQEVVDSEAPALVVAPSPHDAHPGHEMVGRTVVSVLELSARTLRADALPALWLWGLWADLPFPTVALSFGEERMSEVLHVLEAHAGELERNDYRRVVRGRAEMNASLGPERIFGFGSTASESSPHGAHVYAELLTEVFYVNHLWRLGPPRWLDAADPLAQKDSSPEDAPTSIGDWLHEPSPSARHAGRRRDPRYDDDPAGRI